MGRYGTIPSLMFLQKLFVLAGKVLNHVDSNEMLCFTVYSIFIGTHVALKVSIIFLETCLFTGSEF